MVSGNLRFGFFWSTFYRKQKWTEQDFQRCVVNFSKTWVSRNVSYKDSTDSILFLVCRCGIFSHFWHLFLIPLYSIHDRWITWNSASTKCEVSLVSNTSLLHGKLSTTTKTAVVYCPYFSVLCFFLLFSCSIPNQARRAKYWMADNNLRYRPISITSSRV